MIQRLTKMIGTGFRKIIKKDTFTHQTFTYFVPSPPERKSGYREKQFDKIVFDLLQKGYSIDNIHTENNSHGMWIILTLKTYKDDLEADLNFPEPVDGQTTFNSPKKEHVEGLYYID